MKFSYYPGCTLKSQARELDESAHRVSQILGFSLCELPEWQCCGGVFPMSRDELAQKLSSVRALAGAQDGILVTLCSACHNVLKQVNDLMINDPERAERVNHYLSPDISYHGETRVVHYLELLRDTVGYATVSERVKNPLSGRRVASYYGCLLLRPSKIMKTDDPENPRIMEELVSSLGAEAVAYPMRNECCGAYLTLENEDVCEKRCRMILDSAKNAHCDTVITACPLCCFNLKKYAEGIEVMYFTELMEEALSEGGK